MCLSRRRNVSHPNAIRFNLRDYLELIRGAEQAIRDDKRCKRIYLQAKRRNPNRWSRDVRNWVLPEKAWLNPEKAQPDLSKFA